MSERQFILGTVVRATYEDIAATEGEDVINYPSKESAHMSMGLLFSMDMMGYEPKRAASQGAVYTSPLRPVERKFNASLGRRLETTH